MSQTYTIIQNCNWKESKQGLPFDSVLLIELLCNSKFTKGCFEKVRHLQHLHALFSLGVLLFSINHVNARLSNALLAFLRSSACLQRGHSETTVCYSRTQ